MEVKEYPVYQVKVKSAKAPVHYCYSIDYSGTDYSSKGVVREQIDRVLNSGDETLNEFFDRSITVKEHPALPKAYPSFERYSPSKLYDGMYKIIIKKVKNYNEYMKKNGILNFFFFLLLF